ncbi:MAG: HEAT repeat domain-containing protein [Promethearchaeati archaeon SRVP18_Atabeyarchaeia-1]
MFLDHAIALGLSAGAVSLAKATLSMPSSVEGAPFDYIDPTLGILLVMFFIMVIFIAAVASTGSRAHHPPSPRTEAVTFERQTPVGPLIEALKSTDWETRREMVSALGNIGDERAVTPLTGVLLHDENNEVRQEAASWLGHLCSEQAVPFLLKVVKDYLDGAEKAVNVVIASAIALGEIGSQESLATLRRLATDLGQKGMVEDLRKVNHATKDIQLANDLTRKKCIVCNLPLGKDEQLVQCPFCKNVAHKDHMLDWLSGRDYCPTCRTKVKGSQLIPIQFQSLAAVPKSRPVKRKQ